MKFKILIVDDDANLLSVLKDFFTDENHAAETCSNGADAILKFRQESFDLVITDLIMPGMNGLDVLGEVKKIDPAVLVILITGFASLETAIEAIREGAYDYITKPFKLEEIGLAVENALDKIRLVRENRKLFNELQEAYQQLQAVKGPEGGADGRDGKDGPGGGKKTFIAGDVPPCHFIASAPDRRAAFVSDLERISRLRDEGFISKKEFELCKSRLFQSLK